MEYDVNDLRGVTVEIEHKRNGEDKMRTIFNDTIVKNELKRIGNTKLDFKERNVLQDLDVITEAFKEIDKLVNGGQNQVKIKNDMWEECHKSLDKVVEYYGLQYVDSKQTLGEVVVKR